MRLMLVTAMVATSIRVRAMVSDEIMAISVNCDQFGVFAFETFHITRGGLCINCNLTATT
jgi:phosphoribosylaminoimidazole carboxylase (NCAIR synthetase)